MKTFRLAVIATIAIAGPAADWPAEDPGSLQPEVADREQRQNDNKGDRQRVREEPENEGLQRNLQPDRDRFAHPVHPQPKR